MIPEAEALVTTRALVVGYRGRGILPPLDWRVRPGEFWAVVGTNGSGKTTLLRTLLGLLAPVSGALDWNDAARVSYVAQRNELDESVPGRVEDFVRAEVDRGWSFLGWRGANAQAVHEALRAAKCESLLGQQISSLSEGQRGRVRIARALVSRPNALVLDEPTSAVDAVTEQSIFGTLDELRRDTGVTLIVVSHRAHVLAGRATHAVLVQRDNGTAVTGAFEEVARMPNFPAGWELKALERH